MLWLAGFVSLSAIGVALAAYSRDEDARLLAIGLLLLALSVIPTWYGHALYLLSVADMLVWCVAFVMWDVRRALWLRSFLTLSSLRLGLHIAIGLAPESGATPFVHMLNAAFVAQVYIISKQGGSRLGDRIADRLRGVHARYLRPLQAASVRLTADG